MMMIMVIMKIMRTMMGDYYYNDKDCCGVNSYDYNVDRITSSSHISENLLQILILSIKLPVLHFMRYTNF